MSEFYVDDGGAITEVIDPTAEDCGCIITRYPDGTWTDTGCFRHMPHSSDDEWRALQDDNGEAD
jgi:hypothetical protein